MYTGLESLAHVETLDFLSQRDAASEGVVRQKQNDQGTERNSYSRGYRRVLAFTEMPKRFLHVLKGAAAIKDAE
jgi:hypothetical protein